MVVAADHPGLWLYDNLARFCPDPATGDQAVGDDADAVLEALAEPAEPLAFDLERIAVAGHSAGGSAVASRAAYDDSPAPKRFVLLERAGHLAFSDICDLENAAGQNLLETAEAAEVCGAALAGFLFDCSDSLLEGPTAHAIVDYTTTATLEGALFCRDDDPFETLEATFPEVEESLTE